MAVYWYAYDSYKNEYFRSPTSFSGDSIIRPDNPFPQMIVMKNMQGYHFELYNDVSWELPNNFINITKKVYLEYLAKFPWAIEYYEVNEL